MPDFLAEALTWPSSYQYLIAVQTAYEMRLPPTMFLDFDSDGSEWSVADRKLTLAWNVLQRETCRQCGQPLWICRSNSNNLEFKIRTAMCYATQTKAKWDGSKRGKSLKDGEYGYIVPELINTELKMPSRQDWLKQLQDESEE